MQLTTPKSTEGVIIPKILATNDYRMFHHLKGNRDIRPAHVKELMAAYVEKPQLRTAKPVLLNENYDIIDGQHGFTASRNLGLQVFYMIVPGLTIADARLLNALQKTWSMLDFAKSYAEDGKEEYRLFLQLMEEYRLPPSTMLTYMTGKYRTNGSAKFKLGSLTLRPEEDIITDLRNLEKFSDFVEHWNEQSLALAYWTMRSIEGYDHNRMLKQLEDTPVRHQADRYSYLRELEQIYNKRSQRPLHFF